MKFPWNIKIKMYLCSNAYQIQTNLKCCITSNFKWVCTMMGLLISMTVSYRLFIVRKKHKVKYLNLFLYCDYLTVWKCVYVGSMNGKVILISHYTSAITPAYGLQPTANTTTTNTALRCTQHTYTSYS